MASTLLMALAPLPNLSVLNQSSLIQKGMITPMTLKPLATNNKYEVTGTLGKGGFAVVIAVKDENGKEYALKKPFHDKRYVQEATGVINMKEAYAMACLRNPYIQDSGMVFFEDPCPSDGCFLSSDQAYDRMFFMMSRANYTCHELVHQYKCPISHVKRAMFQAACAVHHLHARGISHRDLKPGNLLCYYNRGVLTVKLTDFGMTKPLNNVNKNSLHAGTSYYRSPELIVKNKDYGLPSDIWSLGCTFFEMVARRTPFKADTDFEVLNLIFSCRGSPSHETFRRLTADNGVSIAMGRYQSKSIRALLGLDLMSINKFNEPIVDNLYNPGSLDDFCDLVDKMLKVDPAQRINIEEVLMHPFFSGCFTAHPQDYGLWRPNLKETSLKRTLELGRETIQIFPDNHANWKVGALAIANINTEVCDDGRYDEELSFAIRFHALDIYSRYLLKIEPLKKKVMYEKIAWCSGYIISKYYLDEASYHLFDLFPESEGVITREEIVKIERLILQLIEFEIYRPTCFTYLEHRNSYAGLFALMLTGKIMFGRPIGKIMDIFNASVKKQMTK